jgi:predicted dehydrogenase
VEPLGLPRGPAAHRDRHALDPLSRPDPPDPRRSPGCACQDDRPSQPRHGQTRTTRDPRLRRPVRCALSINHDHSSAAGIQACEFRVSGTEGAAYLQLGVNLDYPEGEPDILEIYPKGGDGWVAGAAQKATGSRMPSSAAWPISSAIASGEDAELVSSVEDAWNTMALVEAAYKSSAAPATLRSKGSP